MRLLVVLGVLLLSGCGLSSEHTLRQNFAAHESEIQQILRMQQHDSNVVRVAPSFTRLKDNWALPRKDIGFSEQRWNEYRKLFKDAGITDGTQVDEGTTFLFVSSAGLGIAGSSRGYAHVLSEPSVVVSALSKCPRKNGVCFVPLRGDWYLFQWVT